MIENLDYFAPDEKIMEGTFTSRFFKNEDSYKLSVYIRNGKIIDYAEKCIEHFNSMPDDMIDEICRRIIKSLKLIGADFELSEFENVRDILNYCWFTSMTVDVTENDGISYIIEGEGDWGEVVGFVIKNGSLAYVGTDIEEYL